MNTQPQRNIHTRNVKAAESRLKDNWLLKQMYRRILRRVFRRLSRTRPAPRSAVPTEAQRNFVLTGLILGFISIFAALFPVCGLPIAIAGLLIGFYGRHTTSLYTMSSWACALSLVGLILAFIYTLVVISIYFSRYLFWPL